MSGKLILLKRLAKKGLRISLRIPAPSVWRQQIGADPLIPRTAVQLRRLWRTLRAGRSAQRLFATHHGRGIVTPRFEECGETLYYRFLAGLANPSLTAADRDGVESEMDADTPDFENETETEHFVLRWTNLSAHPADNVADPAIVTETGNYLEAAWTKYNLVFGRAPYVPEGAAKIEVNFLDINGRGATSPEGPIQLDAYQWINQPGIRQPTSAHELFHRMQYAFGFKTIWPAAVDNQWFSEGTASWAEVFMWQRVSQSEKLTDLFSNPSQSIYRTSYYALPFWIFFDTRQRDVPNDIPLVGYLQKYETTGDEKVALAEAIDEDWPDNAVYGKLDNFVALFARERRLGAWRQTPTGAQPYGTILGPDAAAISPTLSLTDIPLASGDVFSAPGLLTVLGSDYHRFQFQPDADGKTVNVSITETSGDNQTYYLVWEKGGAFTLAEFPFHAAGDFSFSKTVQLNSADALVLIVSGRETFTYDGNEVRPLPRYTINASVT